uniref:Uncharacterized protein n=1 Tax=Triticum urartu TaxID=4572 RepID=A0A8R7QVS8_TRIUA
MKRLGFSDLHIVSKSDMPLSTRPCSRYALIIARQQAKSTATPISCIWKQASSIWPSFRKAKMRWLK